MEHPSATAAATSSPASYSPTSSTKQTKTNRTRTTSVSAATAIVHHPTTLHPTEMVNQEKSTTPPFHMHPWSTERAQVAAETEISPPISPKQKALSSDIPESDFVEPLQVESSLSLGHHTYLSPKHPNSPYTHYHHDRQHQRQSRISSESDDSVLEPLSTGLLLLSRSSTCSSSDSASDSSSASSSSTSLSSVSSVSSVSSSVVSKSSPTRHPLSHLNNSPQPLPLPVPAAEPQANVALSKLETEKSSELFLLDTPPSSHVPSPSSPSCPTLQGPSSPLSTIKATSRTNTTTITTTTISKTSLRPWTGRAPYHCTKKSFPQIVREISDLVDGRDKTIKVVQYFCKVFLWAFLSNPKEYAVFAARMKALAKQFSTTRKVLRLGHFIDPMASVLTLAVALRASLRKNGLRRTLDKSPSQDWRETVRSRLSSLNDVLGFVQDITDDIYCLGVIGVLDRSFADKAEPWSNRLWMVGVSIDLHENLQSIRDVQRQIKGIEKNLMQGGGSEEEERAWRAQYTKLSTKLHWLQVTTVKLGGDFLFCGYDNLHCSFSDGFQAMAGFISGIAGAYKFVGKIMES
ncbi:hypothetical protein BGX28_007692 [Mortierella sp. GBA30]|nr:hypothetical protein BGX28_007692 [Mortierella sp. GBA30]